jgi:hypothetical protein
MAKKYTYKATEEIYAKQIRANYTRFLEEAGDSTTPQDTRRITAQDFESVPHIEAWATLHGWSVLLRKLPGKELTQPDKHLAKLHAANILMDTAISLYLEAAKGVVEAIPGVRKTKH